jgi:hypothetical protein
MMSNSSTDQVLAPQASRDFVQGSEDIPLLLEMQRVSDDNLGFDSNSGSIISSSYETKIPFKMVKEFYLKTLPPMGWNIMKNFENNVSFKRDKENLNIEFLKEDNKKIVKFFISSAL